MVCYGCGDPRHSMCSFSESNSHFVPSLPLSGPPAHPSQRAQTLPPAPSTHTMSLSRNSSPSRDFPTKAPPPTYPLLTPSGHALASGGRVRNISSDPLSPCVMYWPDNEPFPERGQFRPLGSTVMQYPPIVNTGNKGAAEKQPGDWVCSKCHYLNWRRRKVCQTCYPYAEGNGDSISQAVQAERIALLTNVLNSVNTDPAYAYPTHHLHRRASVPAGSSSTTPPFLNTNSQQVTAAISPKGYGGGGAVMGPRIAAVAAGSASARSRSQMDMRTSYRRPYPKHSPSEEFASGLPARLHPQPPVLLPQMHRHQPAAAIYQTKAPDGGYRYGQTGSHPTSPAATTSSARSSRVASPISSASAALERNVVEITPNAANLLPSFLQDLIQTNSPNSSPLISSNNSNYRWHAAQGQRSMSSIHSIHSSPSTSTSSWSLDEYNAQYAGGYDEGPAVHAQPRHPSYEYVSQALYQSQPRSATDTLSSVRTSPTSITNAASAEDDKQTAPSGGVGVIGVGRPSRLGPSNSSASGPSMSGGPGSIWKMDGAEQSNRVWKPAGADVVSAPGVGIGAYAIRNHHSMVAPPRHNGYNAPTGSVLEGHGHRLAGLDEHLAAHLTISG
ncbi:hypothetical protein BC835DRAFT_401695 [Cytidiella melzeri]|nr:hypothetical protein BC835DRAFT_401695 [Cytidiella melzeri]